MIYIMLYHRQVDTSPLELQKDSARTSEGYRSKPQHHSQILRITLQVISGPCDALNRLSGGGKDVIVRCVCICCDLGMMVGDDYVFASI